MAYGGARGQFGTGKSGGAGAIGYLNGIYWDGGYSSRDRDERKEKRLIACGIC